MFSTIRRLLTTTFRIERRNVEALFVLRCSLGVAVALIAGYATGYPLFAVAGAMGAMSTGFASLQGVYRTRAATMLGMAFAMAFSTIVGMLTASSPWLAVATLALWGFAYGILASLGQAVVAVCVNATIALIIFNHFSASDGMMWLTAAFVVGGGALQTLLLVVLWPVQRYPLERAALAGAYRSLATYARTLDCAHPTLPPAAPLQAVRDTLADPRPFGRNAAAAAFTTLLTEAERIRGTLGRIVTRGCDAFEAQRETVATILDAIAAALETATAPSDDVLQTQLLEEHDDAVLRLLFGQLRSAWRSAAVPLRGLSFGQARTWQNVFPDLDESLATLRANLSWDSPFVRHALRLAIVLSLSAAIALYFGWQRGYWMTLTAALVLRPDFTTTLSRGIGRIAGTLIGVGVATALVVLLPNSPFVALAFAVVFVTLAYATFQLNFGLFSLNVTAYVVFILSLLGVPEEAAIINRLGATVAGGTLATLSYLLWPTWESPHTRARILELLETHRLYTRALLTGLIDPQRRDVQGLYAVRKTVWRARAAAHESLERMLAEPSASHDMEADLAVATMAASLRIGLADLSSSSLYIDPSAPAYPEAEPFARAVESAMAGITMAIERGTPPFAAQLLRDAHAALARELPADRYGRTTFLASADLLVDGINTIGDLWSHRGAKAG